MLIKHIMADLQYWYYFVVCCNHSLLSFDFCGWCGGGCLTLSGSVECVLEKHKDRGHFGNTDCFSKFWICRALLRHQFLQCVFVGHAVYCFCENLTCLFSFCCEHRFVYYGWLICAANSACSLTHWGFILHSPVQHANGWKRMLSLTKQYTTFADSGRNKPLERTN